MDKILNDFQALNFPAMVTDRLEPNWDVCLSANYLSKGHPNGVMFGALVAGEKQPEGFDIFKVTAALYARIRMYNGELCSTCPG